VASEETPEPVERQVERRLRSTVLTVFVWLVTLGVLGLWLSTGFFTLDPGEEAVVLRFGEYDRTLAEPGIQLRLPPPIETHAILNTSAIEREEFGAAEGADAAAKSGKDGEKGGKSGEAHLGAPMQTGDNNLVIVGYVVQYRIADAFDALYRVSDPRAILRDAAEASVREVVGRSTIDGVLSEQRGQVEAEAEEALQNLMESYQTGVAILAVQLQEVQPPQAVRGAFDDVIAAMQDKSRSMNEAEGFANEVVPEARGEASELRERAQGYKAARIAEATGAASRFKALAAEYRRAPEVTRTRLWLETMEEVLPEVEKYVVSPGSSAGVVPYLPLGAPPREPGAAGSGSRRERSQAAPKPGAPAPAAPKPPQPAPKPEAAAPTAAPEEARP